jgi:glycosyltransferase involved in cell wall biosynthesis
MRIMYFVGRLEAGGLERFVTNTALRAKEAKDFEPIVCCLIKREGIFIKDLEDNGIRVIGAPKNWFRDIRKMIELGKIIQQYDVDIVHSQVNFSMFQQLITVRLAGVKNFMITERSEYRRSALARLRRIIQFHALRLFGANYSANSPAVGAHLAKMVLVSQDSIAIFPNGVKIMELDSALRAKMRAFLNWDDDTMGIVCVARLATGKGQELLLQSAKHLYEKFPNLRICLVGDGPQREVLQDLAESLKLSAIVHFAGTVGNVPDYLQAADISCLLSSREGMPNAILEAMSAGNAIIASSVGALPELLNDGHAGIILESLDVESIAASFTRLIDDENFRFALGKKARERIDALYSIEKTYQALLSYYHSLLKR